MKAHVGAFLLGLIFLPLVAGSLIGQDDPAATELLFVSGAHVERWSLQIRIDDVSPATVRLRTLQSLVKLFDTNGDQQLSPAESHCLPSRFCWRQLAAGRLFAATQTPPASADLNENGLLSSEELAAYYDQDNKAGVVVALGVTPATVQLNDALLSAIGVADGRPLNHQDWRTAVTQLMTRDANGDELIGAGELLDGVKYPGIQATSLVAANQFQADRPLIVLPPNAREHQWAAQLLNHLDHDHNESLDASEFIPTTGQFSNLDRNRDETIDVDELRQWHNFPAAHKVDIELTTESNGAGAFQVGDEEKGVSQALRFQSASQSNFFFVSQSDNAAWLKQIDELVDQFIELAKNTNGQIPEGALNRTELLEFTELMDADRNHLVSIEEAQRWRNWARAARTQRCVISVIDLEQSFFAMLDAGHDGSLSSTELADGWRKINATKMIREGRFTLSNMPRQWRVFVGNSIPNQLLAPTLQVGPVWFQAMDRNADGQVSHGEFLGSAAEFRKRDHNQDGRLSLDEL